MSSPQNDGLIEDTLFVGLTRPPMIFGVTYTAFVLNSIVSMESFIVSNNLLYLLIFLPIHFVCYAICKNDPRTFDIFMLWARTKGASFVGSALFWKCSTYSPNEITIFKRDK